jgi:hypothetical protein
MGLASKDLKTAKTKKPSCSVATDELDRVYRAYPLKRDPADAKKAISKAFDRLTSRGESDPASFLIERIEAMKILQARNIAKAKGGFVPSLKNPATWFNKESYDNEELQPVKNCVLPNGQLGTEADLAQTGWQVVRGGVA